MPTRTPDAFPAHPARPHADLAGNEAPAIPSLASLRDPRRRTAVDVLVPAAPTPAPPPRTTAPRPAEWADLWIFGASVARTVGSVPGRLLAWQTSCLRRVLGR
jgi:hypothetical protein